MRNYFFEIHDCIIYALNLISIFLTLSEILFEKITSKEKKEKNRKNKNKIRLTIIRGATLGSIIASLAIYSLSQNYVEIPDLENLKYETACGLLAQFGIRFKENENYATGNYYVESQSKKAGTLFHKKNDEALELVCKKVQENKEESPAEEYILNNLSEDVCIANIGDTLSLELNILTPEKYKFETTPFVLYCGYYDRELGDWVQISGKYISAGEINYLVNIDTGQLGIGEGEYIRKIVYP